MTGVPHGVVGAWGSSDAGWRAFFGLQLLLQHLIQWLRRRVATKGAQSATGPHAESASVAGDTTHTRALDDVPEVYVESPRWSSDLVNACDSSRVASEEYKWALMVPVTSRRSAPEECWDRLAAFAESVARTTSPMDRTHLVIIVGIDSGDKVYDNEEGRARLVDTFETNGLSDVHVKTLHGLSGMLCQIWNTLAACGMTHGADFYVLLGGDTLLQTKGWKRLIEEEFVKLSRRHGLAFGRACVVFRDRAFKGFPTFPVLHRSHLEAFEGKMLPSAFINQGGDPYLFALYRRWGVAVFAEAWLKNSVGGDKEARYAKQPITWKCTLLQTGLERLTRELGPPTHICLDIVVPTFRCDVSLLERMTKLRVPDRMAVTTTIIVDKPASSAVPALRQLAVSNSGLRVIVNDTNMGVSVARNTGISSTEGDWILFLDDDVDVSSSDLLWWYSRAILRHPEAKGFVGLTTLPPATNLWTQALVMSGVTYFYSIATRMRHPPWGVGANLVLKRRANDTFFRHYRKHGGGEDVDICLRARGEQGHLVAVPQAEVKHPWWNKSSWSYGQVVGWAIGDSKCVDFFPDRTLLQLPTGTVIAASLFSCFMPVRALLVCIVDSLFMTFCILTQHRINLCDMHACAVAWLAATVIIVQEWTRVFAHVRRLRPANVFLDFDFMGEGETSQPLRQRRFATALATVLASFVLSSNVFGITCLVVMTGLLSWWTLSHGRRKPTGTEFVVLSHKRSGTNLLCGILHLHPEILMHNELFNEREPFTYHPDMLSAGKWDKTKRDLMAQEFLDWILTQRATAIRTTIGFKSFEEHWTNREHVYHASVLGRKALRKIILRRGNLLSTYVSYLRSETTGRYLRERYESLRVNVDPDAFLKFVHNYNACFKRYDEGVKGQHVLRIMYEDLVGSKRQEVLRSVYDFLGVTSSVSFGILPETRQQSGVGLGLEHAISNFELLIKDPRMQPYLTNL